MVFFRRKKQQEQEAQAQLPSLEQEEAQPIEEARENVVAAEEIAAPSLLGRLKRGLSKTSHQLSEGISSIFHQKRLDAAMVEELEEVLIMADMGVAAAARITTEFAKDRYDNQISSAEVKSLLAAQIGALLQPVERAITVVAQPTIIMVVGVNGNGKTTTIGKLAAHFTAQGKSVMLAAADTFRAAAVEQLQVWAERAGVPIVIGAHQADPASVAFQAVERAQVEGVDVLLIDTAGRLQNKTNLMQELQKIHKVLGKQSEGAPHHVLMVLDGTTGQNALSQVKAFQDMVAVSGLAVTKLDGTAKGGVVVALAHQCALPVHFVGVGEAIEDLQPFNAHDFAEQLMGI